MTDHFPGASGRRKRGIIQPANPIGQPGEQLVEHLDRIARAEHFQ